MTAPVHIHFVLHAMGIATVLLIIAFFVFFAAQRSMGFVAGFGTLLGLWLVVIALLIVAGAVTMPMFGGKPFGLDFPDHGRWMHPDAPAAPPPGEPAPTAPEASPAEVPAEPAPAPSGQ